jgi:hypothetical protein
VGEFLLGQSYHPFETTAQQGAGTQTAATEALAPAARGPKANDIQQRYRSLIEARDKMTGRAA